ncbi:thioesterase [Ahniella affigens]|uniref:Thioesterase n=1 Tax=Ahniella affigens TaxID=2021234 RepID=A0A2P1PX13_9GAMM|nr:thioesterase family protein [Ahniella affigens]AVP99383.1 thioesterase [Ahniella affigens]
MFRQTFQAGWGDMDFNAHMANTAFLDRAADVRMMFFAAHGFPMSEFRQRRLGPVLFRDEIDYQREISLLEMFHVELTLAGLAPDGSRFIMQNTFTNDAGKLCARIQSSGSWLNLETRKLQPPPPDLLAALNEIARTDTFAELPSIQKPSA